MTKLTLEAEPTDSDMKSITAEKDSLVLDLKRKHRQDTLAVNCGSNANLDHKTTQRVGLSLVSAVFDPIGLVGPYTIKACLLVCVSES